MFTLYFLLLSDPRSLPFADGLLYVWSVTFITSSLYLWTIQDLVLKIERMLWMGTVGFLAMTLAGVALCHPDLAVRTGERMELLLAPLGPFFRLRAGGIATFLVGFFWLCFCLVGIPFVRQLRAETPVGRYPR